jgi:hypothetical protein
MSEKRHQKSVVESFKMGEKMGWVKFKKILSTHFLLCITTWHDIGVAGVNIILSNEHLVTSCKVLAKDKA